MSGFSADWLALREPADAVARNQELTARLIDWRQQHGGLSVLDLGSGTIWAAAPEPITAFWLHGSAATSTGGWSIMIRHCWRKSTGAAITPVKPPVSIWPDRGRHWRNRRWI